MEKTTKDNSYTRRYKGPKLTGKRTVLRKGGEGYPDALMQIPEPPKRLFIIGDPGIIENGLSIIGARKATPYGINCAKMFSRIAAEKGIVIVSGGAIGCDSAAHQAAISAGGKTVVILGGGCDELYPARNHVLFQNVIDGGGAVMAEHDWGFPPLPHTFRMRNRLIAGLSRATLIVEAGIPSGTFSTADDAITSNKDVLVIPGAITSPNSMGTNSLLFQGAAPIISEESFEEALFSIFGTLKTAKYPTKDVANNDKLFSAILATPLSIEDMLQLIKEENGPKNSIEVLMGRLSELQRRGLICKYHDGTYGPAEKAF